MVVSRTGIPGYYGMPKPKVATTYKRDRPAGQPRRDTSPASASATAQPTETAALGHVLAVSSGGSRACAREPPFSLPGHVPAAAVSVGCAVALALAGLVSRRG